MKYHIWTEGCQMNVADSQRVASALEQLGYEQSPQVEAADVIVLNTCVVRQSAENKAYGRLSSLRPLKDQNPSLVINLMGCLVGIKGSDKLKERFPYVDVFSPPSDPGPLVTYLTQDESHAIDQAEILNRFAFMDGDLRLPELERGQTVAGYIPIVYGCSHACTFCIIPFRRGIERSRPVSQILGEARAMVAQGVREITLLGQIVDRYGMDQPEMPDLAGLLREMHQIDGLERIRFLTSHPNWMNDELLDCVAELPKVCPHIEVPAQAGDDQVLENMKRGYSSDDYRRLIEKIRQRIRGVSIATDIIVGFPGETTEQFQHTYDLLAELKLDVAHLARYSSRPGTVATRRMQDDVPEDEKMRRFRLLEELQEGITGDINQRYLGTRTPVLFEEKVKERWKGRTPTNKLVFVESPENLRGQVREAAITWTRPMVDAGENLELFEGNMKPGKVRPIAICLVQHDGRVLVARYDELKRSFYRPLGGKIEFGERGVETIAREFMEEIHARVTDIHYLGMIENIFTVDGQQGHEIVLVYGGNLADEQLYAQPVLTAREDDGSEFPAVWMPVDDFRKGRAIVYPEGVLELI